MNLHQRKPVGQPRVASLNDRSASCYHPGGVRRDEETGEWWYRQVKETKRDGTGAGSLSMPIVPVKTANRTRESRWRKGACRVMEPLLGNMGDSQKSWNV